MKFGGKGIPKLILAGLAIAFIILFFSFQSGATEGIRNGLTICGTVIIPSLFPMMAVTSFLIKSGISGTIGQLLSPITRFVFGLPGCAGPAILLGFVGGFPVGARAAALLYAEGQITRGEAIRMMCFCVNAGPAFMINAIGFGVYGDAKIGVMLYISQIAASFILGIASRLVLKESPHQAKSEQHKMQKTSVISAFVSAVSDATNGILVMCGFILLFSAVMGVCTVSGIGEQIAGAISTVLVPLGTSPEVVQSILPGILEVTSGCLWAGMAGAGGLVAISAITGWGGLSVHFQIFSCVQNIKPKISLFWIFRLASAALSAVITMILLRITPGVVEVGLEFHTYRPQFSSISLPASLAMLLFSAVVILSHKPITLQRKRGNHSNGVRKRGRKTYKKMV